MKPEVRRVDRDRRTVTRVAGLLLGCALVVPCLASGGGLDDAIALYQEARYDEALQLLDDMAAAKAGPSSDPAPVERVAEYRALCMLALDRGDEARAVLQKLLEARPEYRPSSPELPPRFLAVIEQTRKAMLPTLIREEYRRGKASYDQKSYEEAEVHLRRARLLLDDHALPPEARESLADLRDLADGFLALIPKASTAGAPALPNVGDGNAVAPRPSPPPPPAFYTAADRNVRPPVAVRQQFPPWRGRFDDGSRAPTPGTGVLEVVIDERGRVSSARLASSIQPLYDQRLLSAARTWQYQPATKDGKPVPFRKVIEVRLADARSPSN